MRTPLPRSRGFTLVELLVVIGIMGVLAGMLLGGIGVVRRQMRIATTKALIQGVDLGLKVFDEHWGYLPPDHPQDLDYALDTDTFDSPRIMGSSNSPTRSATERRDIENANALITIMLTATKKNGPYLELNDENLFTEDRTFSGVAASSNEGKFLKQYRSQYTEETSSGNFSCEIYYIVDAWEQPLVYDLNNPETDGTTNTRLHLSNNNVRGFDLYSWGENGRDDEGSSVGSENDDLNNWE